MQEQTTFPASRVTDTQRLASAIMHLANVFTTDSLEVTLSRVDAARDLVRDLAFPDHAERPSPTPAPSCDAPHCDCDTGEDCHANGVGDLEAHEAALHGAPAAAAERYVTQIPRAIGDGPRRFIVTVDANEVSIDDMPTHGDVDHDPLTDTPSERILAATVTNGIRLDGLCARLDELKAAIIELSARTKPGTLTLDGATIDLGGFLKAGGAGVTVLGDDSTRIQTATPTPDLAARLDGLKAAVDALAEHLERGPATGTKYDPVLVKVGRVTVSYPFQQEEWTCAVDLLRVKPGRYVRDQKGSVAQVASMMHDTDGTSRLTVDVVDEEG